MHAINDDNNYLTRTLTCPPLWGERYRCSTPAGPSQTQLSWSWRRTSNSTWWCIHYWEGIICMNSIWICLIFRNKFPAVVTVTILLNMTMTPFTFIFPCKSELSYWSVHKYVNKYICKYIIYNFLWQHAWRPNKQRKV